MTAEPAQSDPAHRRLLLFGASGFTGQHLQSALAETARWAVVDARARGAELTEPATLEAALDGASADAVINLAAISATNDADPARLYAVNAFGWRNLLRALTGRRFPGRVIFASTANLYGGNTTGPISEDRPPEPSNHYGLSKWLAEQFSRLDGAGLDLVTTRPFNCIGRGQKPGFLLPKIIAHFRDRRPVIELGNLDVERDMVDIRDVADAYVRLLEAPEPPRLVNIGSGQTQSLTGIIDILRRLTGHDMEVRVNPAFVRSNEIRHQQGDISRLRELGYTPRYSISETLDWMLHT